MNARDIIIQEVCPRDGLQIEPVFVETAEKVALIDQLSSLGFSRIEAGAFVSPKAVPALRDGEDVFRRIRPRDETIFVALIPNLKGALRALDAGAGEVNLVVSASETHNLANMGMRVRDSLGALQQSIVRIERKIPVNATVATAFGCPFEGKQDEAKVLRIIETYLQLGADGITLADTTGMAGPKLVRARVKAALTLVPREKLTLHFHNTRGLGLVNVLAAAEVGGLRFDSALGGLGGCPFAPGATGNVCTEDLVNLCHEMGLRTGLDLQSLIRIARELPRLVGHPTAGQVAKAGRADDLHPIPVALRRELLAES